MPHHPTPLSPKPTRLIAFAVMLLIAVASIWVVDRRAIQRMHELDGDATLPGAIPGAIPGAGEIESPIP